MADLTCTLDWRSTPVGNMHQWPDLLLSTVNMLLASQQPMFLWWGEELTQFYNDAYRPSLGADKHPSALGQRGPECWPEIWPVIGPLIDDVMKLGRPYWSENQLIPIFRNGRLEDVYWTFSYSPVWDANGIVRGTLVVCSETTGKVLAEKAVTDERLRLLEVLQQAPAFFALLEGPDHVITMVNPLYLRLVNNRDVLGKPVRVALPEAVEQGYLELLDRVYQGERYLGFDARFDSFAGEGLPLDERYVDFIYEPLRGPEGEVTGIIALGVDVTDRKRSHDALLQNEKLAAVGRLASSIAHEINNPLEAVTNLIYLARGSESSSETQEYLSNAEVELRRVSAITNQTLRFHRQTTSPTSCTAEDLVSSTLSIYQGRLANTHIQILRRDRARRPLRCFEGEIRQVLSNFIGNAIDSINNESGRLLIRTRDGINRRTGELGLVITLADSGVGMNPITASCIFEPFFTTKGLSGTGLGLWVSREIVDRHRGHIAIKTSQRPNHSGTVFTIFLPYEESLQNIDRTPENPYT